MTHCVNCQFYDRHNVRSSDGRAVQWGLCRRQPPHLNSLNAKVHMVEGVWPTVRDDDWCGEWEAQRRRAPERAAQPALSVAPAATPTAPRPVPAQGGAANIAAGFKPLPAKQAD